MSGSQSVVVIGAGIIGATAALALVRQGRQVTLIDKETPGHGASFGNASILAAADVVPLAYPGAMKNVPRWLLDPEGPLFLSPTYLPTLLPWLARFMGNCTLKKTEACANALAGLLSTAKSDSQALLKVIGREPDMSATQTLRLYPTQAAFEKDTYRLNLRKRHNIDFQLLDQAAIARLEPSILEPYQVGVLIEGTHHFRDPLHIVSATVSAFTSLGGRLIRDCAATLVPRPDRAPGVNLCDGEMLEADHVVLSCGIASRQMAADTGDRFPLESERGYHVHFEGAHIGLRRAVVDPARGFAVSPSGGGLRVAGTVEFNGAKAAPNYRRAKVLHRHALRLFGKTLSKYETSEWMGHRPSLPDSMPVIGPSAKQQGLFYAFGHGHLGLTLAATTARLIADNLGREYVDNILTPFRPERFRGGRA